LNNHSVTTIRPSPPISLPDCSVDQRLVQHDEWPPSNVDRLRVRLRKRGTVSTSLDADAF
jgi:hypothetical protein